MRVTGYIAAFSAGVFFGLSDSLVRAASRRLSPYSNLLISLLVGTPLLWIAVLLVGSTSMSLEALVSYIVAGLLNFVLGRLLFYIAVSSLGAATATVATSPVTAISSLLAWPILGERLTLLQILGVILSSLAVYIASTRPSGRSFHGERVITGLVAALSASLVFALATIIVRYAAYRGGDPIAGTAISYTVAIPFAALIVLARREHREIIRLSKEHIYMIIAAISVASAQLSRYYALTVLNVADAVVLIGLFPLHTTAFTAVMTRATEEKPGKRHILAAIIASIAIILVTRG